MKEKKKIKLEDLTVKSFVTSLDDKEEKVIKGGGTTLIWCCLDWLGTPFDEDTERC